MSSARKLFVTCTVGIQFTSENIPQNLHFFINITISLANIGKTLQRNQDDPESAAEGYSRQDVREGIELFAALMDPRVDFVSSHRLALVQHKVGGEEHEEGELVALGVEAQPGDLERQPPEPRTGDEHLIQYPVKVQDKRRRMISLLFSIQGGQAGTSET